MKDVESVDMAANKVLSVVKRAFVNQSKDFLLRV